MGEQTEVKAGPDPTAFYQPELASILKKQRLTENITLLTLRRGDGQPLGHEPGQFVQISLPGYGEAPISISSSPTQLDTFELCVQAVGNLSRAMHDLRPRNTVGIRGPYGHGFPVEEMKGKDVLLVAGGIGMAPLRSVINYILHYRSDYERVVIIYGARTPDDLLFRDEIEQWEAMDDVETYITIDTPAEGWDGLTGVVTVPLRSLEIEPERTVASVVGPPAMYRFVAFELFEKNIPHENIFFSLERRFKCGMGKCGHCQLNDLYVCQDGPVFRYTDLVGRSEAMEVWAPEE
ncbi:MAG: FAD/NAD(P)-binding protein [Armatimonadetes bacterium]|nr:FAD/NAD(P)-binding protein [Armatimonadota bacterium]